MSGGGLDELTTAQKRALLAEHLRKRSLAPSPAIADDAAPAPAGNGAAPWRRARAAGPFSTTR